MVQYYSVIHYKSKFNRVLKEPQFILKLIHGFFKLQFDF